MLEEAADAPLRLIMMGTGPFALPTFQALYDTPHDVAALVTQPPRPVRGHRKPPPNPMRETADAQGTQVLDPESINTADAHELLRQHAADLFIVCDYGQILSPDTLGLARLGGINLHGSLLPKYRGAAPVNWAIYHGETETGVTVIHMTPRVDAGPCLAQARLAIGPDETAEELERRLADLGAPLVCQTIDALQQGDVQPIPQDAALASRARRLRKSDGEVDWTRNAQQIHDHIRAMRPWPGCYTFWHRPSGEPLRVILGRSTPCAPPPEPASPGTVIDTTDGQLIIATGSGAVKLDTLQPAGKRVMSAAEFLRGYRVEPGQRFG